MSPVVHRLAAAAAALALLAAQAPAQASTAGKAARTSAAQQKNPLAGLDQYVERAMKEWHVPGLAIAIVKDDSVVYAKG
ncbi:MAG TPA: hypothetical protein VFT57_08470, partial [Gemmatimonadaceae bacterium]|nr:hypothetical protein [Gemmatimonadaceae bacterium]